MIRRKSNIAMSWIDCCKAGYDLTFLYYEMHEHISDCIDGWVIASKKYGEVEDRIHSI